MINHTVGLCVLELIEYKCELVKNNTFTSLLSSFSFFYYFHSVQLLFVEL